MCSASTGQQLALSTSFPYTNESPNAATRTTESAGTALYSRALRKPREFV